MQQSVFIYLQRQGDNALILGQRLSEWCGHGPVLEEDIALTNTALDLIGQATLWLDYAAKVENAGKDADQLAFLRDVYEFKNCILVELPNGDYAFTIARQFLFSAYQVALLEELVKSNDEQLKGIAAKSLKEARYHLKHSRDWVLRMGDGTEESHDRIQKAFHDIWQYTGELFSDDAVERDLHAMGMIPLNESLHSSWLELVKATLAEATLDMPTAEWMQEGGRNGRHGEHLGHLLSEMQFLQRAYPGAKW
jgi:ring-1,2-phenylacetyl-CoA epoxidase subunit PaaC